MRRKTLGVARVVRQPVQVFYMQTAAPRTVDAPTLVFQIRSASLPTTGRGPGTLACHSAPGTVAHSKSTQLFFSPLELDDAGVSVTE